MSVIGWGYPDTALAESEVSRIVTQAFAPHDLQDGRVLLITPDATRSAPLPMMFRILSHVIGARVATLDVLVALGTHRPLDEAQINRLFGLTSRQRAGRYGCVGFYNHAWHEAGTFRRVGTLLASEIEAVTGGLMRVDVPVEVNKMLFDYDLVVICGPTFPHEVVGFSGGNKYLFPGVAGPQVIHFSHWLGALLTNRNVIGRKHTPVREVIDRAAALVQVPKLCLSLVVRGREELVGLYAGAPEEAYAAAADLSALHHVVTVDRPFKRALAVIPEMYEDLWTAGKGMYKLEPAIADGGEVVLYAPHVTEISTTHGELVEEIGYHVRDYYLQQWDRFAHYPWGVLAHSTHLRGDGTFERGVEHPRIRVTLATGIPRTLCERVGLGYLDPAAVDPDGWRGREDEGVLLVPRAGETLYRVGGPVG